MKHWKILVGIAVSIIFLYFAFGNIDWSKLWGAIIEVDKLKASMVIVIVGVMLLLRGYRWKFFLKPVKKIGVIPLFWSTAIGFGVNNTMPARLGEVARAYSIHKKANIKFGEAFGTIVVERLYDTFSILVLFVVCLFVFDFPDLSGLLGRSQTEIAILLGILVAMLLLIIVLLKWQTDRMLWIGDKVLLVLFSFLFFLSREGRDRWRNRIIELMRSFIDGLTQSTNPLEMIWIVVLSFTLWIISAFTVHLCIDAFHIQFTVAQTMVVLMSMVIAVSIPAAPGYAGTYHYLASSALMLVMDMPKEQALSIATVIHALNYIPQTALGLSGLFYEGIRFSDVQDAADKVEHGNEEAIA